MKAIAEELAFNFRAHGHLGRVDRTRLSLAQAQMVARTAARTPEVMVKIRANPAKYDQYKMIELLKPLAYDDMIQANLNGIRTWRNNGWRDEGTVHTISTSAGEATEIAGGSTRVVITMCKDQREVEVVDAKGKKVTAKAAQFPDFLQNTYEMRKQASGTFKLWELAGKAVEGCAS